MLFVKNKENMRANYEVVLGLHLNFNTSDKKTVHKFGHADHNANLAFNVRNQGALAPDTASADNPPDVLPRGRD